MRLRRCHACFRCAAISACLPLWAAGAEPLRDVEYLEGLRERRLYTLAADYCQRTLQRPDIEPARRIELTVEWQRTLAAAARELPPESRGSAWQQAHALAASFPDPHPARELVEFQAALTWLSEGELARWEAEGTPQREHRWDAARHALRQAVLGLEQLERVREDAPAGLARSVSVALARAYRNQAACYPPRSPDWVEALTQALARLQRIAESPQPDDVSWEARFDWVACQRDLGRYDEAVAALRQLPGTLPARFALRQQLEAIRLELARGDVLAAEARLAESPSWRDAEWDFVQLEIVLARVEQADEVAREALFEQAAKQIDALEDRHGSYWMRRGELRLAKLVADRGSSPATALLRAASSYARSGQWEAALNAYDAASQSARLAGDGKTAFDAAFIAATLAHDRHQHAVATERFATVALEFRRHARAGTAHQLAIYHAGELVRRSDGKDRPQRLAEYRSLLLEHLALWPRDGSTPWVRRWLADLYRAEREWQPAVEHYQAIPPADAAFTGGIAALVECWQRLLNTAGDDASQLATEAAEGLATVAEQIGEGSPEDLRRSWQARLAASEFLLQELSAGEELPHGVARAGGLLDRIDEVCDALTAAEVQRARGVRAVVLAATGQFVAAHREVAQMDIAVPEPLLLLLDRLAQLSAGDVATLRLQIAERLEGAVDPLPAQQQRRVAYHRAAALAACGRRPEAVELFVGLAAADPDDVEVGRALAATLAESTEPQDLRAAARRYLLVERQLQGGSDPWFEVRFCRAELLVRLGAPQQASKLVRITQVLHPDLGGPRLAMRFQELLSDAERAEESSGTR